MTLMSEIATEGLREIGVVASDEQPTADEIANAIRALNRMLSAWALRLQYFEHGPLEPSDVFPLLPEFEEGTIYNLAARLSGTYQVPVAFNPETWFREIQSAYAVIDPVSMPTGLTRMPSQYWPRTGIR